MNQKILIVILVAVIIVFAGGMVYFIAKSPSRQACPADAKLCPDGSSVGRTGLNCEFAACPETKNETLGWKTYRDDKYKFSIKYPHDWRIIDFQSETNMGTLDTFGFIPLTLKNSYCDIEQETTALIQNYKTYNPFPGYEEYARTYTKVQSCSISVRAEENSEKSSIKDYLKKVYLPIASNKPETEEKINNLVVAKNDEVEQVRNSYTFLKYLGGIDGSYLETSISDRSPQIIINTGKNVIFISDHISQSIDQKAADALFEKIVRSFQILQ